MQIVLCSAVLFRLVGCRMQVPGRLRDKKLAAISEQIMSAPDCLKHSFDDWDEEGDDAMSDENHVMITKITMMMLMMIRFVKS